MINTETEFLSANESVASFQILAAIRAGEQHTGEKYIRFDDRMAIDVFINQISRKRQVLLRAYEEYQTQLVIAQDLLTDLQTAFPQAIVE